MTLDLEVAGAARLAGDGEEEAGAVHNHRGWKAMPYVIGDCHLSLFPLHADGRLLPSSTSSPAPSMWAA